MAPRKNTCFLGGKDVIVIFHIAFSPTLHYSASGIFEKIFYGCFVDIHTLQSLLEEKEFLSLQQGMMPKFFNSFLGLS